MALAASTHIVVPVQLEPKSFRERLTYLEWYYHHRHLRLKPQPEVLGFVPNQYDSRRAAHRQLNESLPAQLEQMNIRAFPAIRDSAEFINASGQGCPYIFICQSHPALGDFKEIASHLAALMGKPQ